MKKLNQERWKNSRKARERIKSAESGGGANKAIQATSEETRIFL